MAALHDCPYTNGAWARVAGCTIREFNHLEMNFLWNIDMGVSEKEWQDWQIKLMRLWCYENAPSFVPVTSQYRKPCAANPPTDKMLYPKAKIDQTANLGGFHTAWPLG